MALVAFLGREAAAMAVGAILVGGLVLVHLKLSKIRLGPLERAVARFERPGVTPGYGALSIAAGVLAILTLLPDASQIYASLIILGFGDAASTLVGRRSRKKLPYNKRKTIGGTLAFLVFSLPAILYAGPSAIIVCLAAALMEGTDLGVDDNLTVPLACVLVFRLLGA
jgi:dolichol kinase